MNPEQGLQLTDSLERELHRVAARHMRKERQSHTLQTTAVVNEAWLRVHDRLGQCNDRRHFLAVASTAMRRLLVDYARSKQTDKRQGVSVTVDVPGFTEALLHPDILDVHAALEEMVEVLPRPARLVELRFFGGLSADEAADVLGISPRTADKDWMLARAWLRARLSKDHSQ